MKNLNDYVRMEMHRQQKEASTGPRNVILLWSNMDVMASEIGGNPTVCLKASSDLYKRKF